MKNTTGACLAAGGLKPPKSPAEDLSNAKRRRTFAPSLRLINFVLHMYKLLTSEQRYIISVLLQKKCSLSFIAKTIGICVSTVSREKRRNSNVQGVYDGRLAALKAKRRKARTPGNRSISPYLRCRVFELIRREQWSPEQVSGWLMKQEGLSVSKSSIYNWIAAISPYHKDNIRRHLRHGG